MRERFVQVGAGYSAKLRWREIDTVFENPILTGGVINSRQGNSWPRQFLEDAREIVERVRDVIQKHNNIKINIAFNGEFISGDKRANKSVNTKNYELI